VSEPTSASAPVRPSCAICRGPLGPDSSPFHLQGRTLFVVCKGCVPVATAAVAGAGEVARRHAVPLVQRALRRLLSDHPVLRAAVDGYIRGKDSAG